MEPTDNITFECFDRHGGKADWATYDFKVIVDGEHVATLSKNVVRRGYRLSDAAGRPIDDEKVRNHRGLEVDTQAQFFQSVRDALPRIPSPDGLRELAIADEMFRVEVEHRARQCVMHNRMSQNAAKLYGVLKNMHRAAIINLRDRLAVSDLDMPLREAVLKASAVIDEIEGPPVTDIELKQYRWQLSSAIHRTVL